MSKAVKIACVYTAIILGAGFASGQELMNFFVKFESNGFIGMIIAGIIFSFIGFLVLDICLTQNIRTYNGFLKHVFGKNISIVMETLVAIFLFVLYSTMLSAGGAVIYEAFSFNFTVGVLIICLLCTLTFFNGALVEINTILAPIMVVGGIFIGLYTFFAQSTVSFLSAKLSISNNWLLSAIIYASYNVVTAISVLVTISNLAVNKKVAAISSILSGASMTLLAFCIALPLYANYAFIYKFEIPLLKIVEKYGLSLEYFYLIILLCAIFTTATANGFAFIEWLCSKVKIKKNLLIVITSLLAALIAHLGFSNFVGKVYPAFGILGLIQVLLILVFSFKKLAYISKK